MSVDARTLWSLFNKFSLHSSIRPVCAKHKKTYLKSSIEFNKNKHSDNHNFFITACIGKSTVILKHFIIYKSK